MTKTADFKLAQLKTSLLQLATHWEALGNNTAYYAKKTATTPDDFPRAIGKAGVYWQTSVALHLLIKNVEALPIDADDQAINRVALDASIVASEVRD